MIIEILQIVLLVPLALAVLYILLFSFAGLFYRQPPFPAVPVFRKIAVMIPGYKEDQVIFEVASLALKQDYPAELFDVVVIADSFQPETLKLLKTLPIIVIEVRFDKSTKAKALNKAMEQLTGPYDIAVVLDADNIMAEDFLHKVNAIFEKPFIAVQGHRQAKNLDTPLAILDAISEEINNHIFRKGHRVIGLSAAIIGSGMAFRYPFFKELMKDVTAVGGFDKEIELKMLKAGHTIEYMDDAAVYDEKVQKAEVFSNQRRRWLSAQLIYFRKSIFDSLWNLLAHGNVDYFDKSIQFIQPPRVLLLGSVLLLSPVFLIYQILLNGPPALTAAWIALPAGVLCALLFSVPRRYYTRATLKAVLTLPAGMFLMLKSLLRIKGANKQFIHTRHGVAGHPHGHPVAKPEKK